MMKEHKILKQMLRMILKTLNHKSMKLPKLKYKRINRSKLPRIKIRLKILSHKSMKKPRMLKKSQILVLMTLKTKMIKNPKIK